MTKAIVGRPLLLFALLFAVSACDNTSEVVTQESTPQFSAESLDANWNPLPSLKDTDQISVSVKLEQAPNCRYPDFKDTDFRFYVGASDHALQPRVLSRILIGQAEPSALIRNPDGSVVLESQLKFNVGDYREALRQVVREIRGKRAWIFEKRISSAGEFGGDITNLVSDFEIMVNATDRRARVRGESQPLVIEREWKGIETRSESRVESHSTVHIKVTRS